MLPAYKEKDKVLVNRWAYILFNPKINDAVIIFKKRIMIKRIKENKNNKFFVVGDNLLQSTDSRHFGLIEKKDILGRVIFKF